MDLTDVHEYLRLRREQDKAEARFKSIKEEADRVESTLLAGFETSGTDRVSIDGSTVYLHRQLWARRRQDAPAGALVEAVKKAGLEQFVTETVNLHTLSSFVRELDREGEPLPAEFDGAVRVDEEYHLRIRAS